MSVCVCITFVVFTDCESCTRPISTNPESMEAGECGRTRGTCLITCRPEVVAVAGLLWFSWVRIDFTKETDYKKPNPTEFSANTLVVVLMFVMRQGRGSEATEAVFFL